MSLTSHASSLKGMSSDMPLICRGTIGTVAHHRVERTVSLPSHYFIHFFILSLCEICMTLSFAQVFVHIRK